MWSHPLIYWRALACQLANTKSRAVVCLVSSLCLCWGHFPHPNHRCTDEVTLNPHMAEKLLSLSNTAQESAGNRMHMNLKMAKCLFRIDDAGHWRILVLQSFNGFLPLLPAANCSVCYCIPSKNRLIYWGRGKMPILLLLILVFHCPYCSCIFLFHKSQMEAFLLPPFQSNLCSMAFRNKWKK